VKNINFEMMHIIFIRKYIVKEEEEKLKHLKKLKVIFF